MGRITRAAPHLEASEVKTRLHQDPRPMFRQRWLIIYNALVAPRAASEIAKHTGSTVAMVHQVIAGYNRLGIAAVETPGKGGRRRKSCELGRRARVLCALFQPSRARGNCYRRRNNEASFAPEGTSCSLETSPCCRRRVKPSPGEVSHARK